MGTGRGLFLGQPHCPLQGGMAPEDHDFGGSPCLCVYDLANSDQIRHGNIYEQGRILWGQSRHCILHKCVTRFVSVIDDSTN